MRGCFWFMVAAAVAAAVPLSTSYPPEQVRLALGLTPASMGVAWTTLENTPAPIAGAFVQWGESPTVLSSTAPGSSFTFFSNLDFLGAKTNFSTHTALMTGLDFATHYFYRVGDPQCGWSEVFDFVTQRAASAVSSAAPQVHLLYGDMGAAFAYSLCNKCGALATCTACTPADLGVVSERADATMVLHVGDLAYDLDSDGGEVGAQFMRNIQPISAYVPLVSIGNHEDSASSLAHFTERFRIMPTTTGNVTTVNGVAPNSWWYSWDSGLVHYVSISTEVQALVFTPDLVHAQFNWLQADLAKANANRATVPWILVNGHRSMYCSCDGDCDAEAQQQRDGPWLNGTCGFEDLFFENGVDFYINGHEHNYERWWPTYKNKTDQSNIDPKATIYVVTGSAGCKELHEPFDRPQPVTTAFRSNTFGYSKLIVYNATHARLQQIMTDPTFFNASQYGKVIDDALIVQHSHGPFSQAAAPKSYPSSLKGTQIDHWDGFDHPAGIELPLGMTWKSSRKVLREHPVFAGEFADATWEDMHKSELERGTGSKHT